MIQIFVGNILLYSNLVIIFAIAFLYLRRLDNIANKLLLISFILLSLCLMNLFVAFIESNYNLALVSHNTHEALPILYKVTAVWGNHSGSFLFLTWLILTTFLLLKHSCKITNHIFLALYLMCNIFLIINSNPFIKNTDIIQAGKGFNPLLQDMAIAIHPPILYLGNTILICIYCLNFSNKNISLIVNLNKIAWTLITFGIALGSWWAYRELGWGGIWFWDPVENISLLPWLCSTVLLHYTKRSHANLSFKILAFSAALSFIYGLVIVRSGVIASVHSFAVDINRGAFLAAIFVILVFMASRHLIKQANIISDKPISFAIKYNNALLILSFFIIISSTIYPSLMNIFYKKEVSVDALFFVNSLTPIIYLILIGIIFLTNRTFFKFNKKIIFTAFCMAMLSVLLYRYLEDMNLNFKIIIILSAITILFSITQIAFSRKKIFMHAGHASFGLLILSLTLHYAFSFTESLHVPNNNSVDVKDFKISFISSEYKQKDNFLTRTNQLKISAPNNMVYSMLPELRFFPVEKTFTVESSIINYNYLHNVYVTTGDMGNKMLAIDFKYQAYVNIIWLSAFLLGSVSALSYLKKKFYDKNMD